MLRFVPELFWLLFTTMQAAARSHQELVSREPAPTPSACCAHPSDSTPTAGSFASGTSCCEASLAGSSPAGAGICPSSHPRRSCTGIGRAGACSGAGSPALAAAVLISAREVRDLIATMSRDNQLWGTERIRGELLQLGIVVSNRSIRRYRWRGPRRPPSQTWRTFVSNHAHHLWAADLF
jgi:hypothetical protein